MNNIIDNEFRISSYLDYNDENKDHRPIDLSNEIERALDWSRDANITIVIPTQSLEDLEKNWIEFNSMSKINRRRSDWKCLEIFGKTNQDIYESERAAMLKTDYDIMSIDKLVNGDSKEKVSVIESSVLDDYYKIDTDNSEVFNYTINDIHIAEEWAISNSRVIIIPTRTLADLESLWDAYNMMLLKHRRESDWKSLELFGVTNLRHYEYLKGKLLQADNSNIEINSDRLIETTYITKSFTKKYLNSVKTESYSNLVECMLNMSVPNKDIYEENITNNIINDLLDSCDSELIAASDNSISFGDMPYISSDEMIDMGVFASNPENNYFGELSDNSMINDTLSVKEWFDLYRYSDKGFYTEFFTYIPDWISKVRELSYGLSKIKESGNDKQINSRKQSLLELGWNPDIPFDNKTRLIASKSASHRIARNSINPKVIDITKFYESSIPDENNIMNETSNNIMKPIYVVFVEGKSYISAAIKYVTKDIYSHAAISLDSSLKNMYSFGISKTSKSEGDGFRIETIDDAPIGSRIRVFTFFVSNNIYKKIKEFIDSFKTNMIKTKYSYTNLLTYLFNIPYNREWSLICSQFVDRCLKAAEINVSGKDSSLLSPHDLNISLEKNNKIYNIYAGFASQYNKKKVDSLIKSLSKIAKPLKENHYISEAAYIHDVAININNLDKLKELKCYSSIVNNTTTRRILETVFDNIEISYFKEAKEFPVQFDKDGNLFIRNFKKINYEAEFAKSHRLLKEYLKSKNIDGMKYELSKLWMMNCKLEEVIYSEKFKKMAKNEIDNSMEFKARAKILNDFKYYLSEVMKMDNEFNFTDYYENTPFSDSTAKINAPTIKYTTDMIKKFITSIV